MIRQEDHEKNVYFLIYVCASVPVYVYAFPSLFNDKIVCKFSENVKSKLYHIENSKTRGLTVKI